MYPPQFENAPRNGAFLVLNLGSNTLGFGNSSAASVADPMPSQSPRHTAVELSRNLHEGSNVDTPSSNSVDGSSSGEEYEVSGSCKNKRVSRGKDDPDWVPEKKLKGISNSYLRTGKLRPGPSSSSDDQYKISPGPSASNNPPKVMPGTSSSNNQPKVSPGPSSSNNPSNNSVKPSSCNSLSGISPEGGSGMPVSGNEPSRYLVRLLSYFGWKVVFQPEINGYVFISPIGIAYSSTQKAFDNFLSGTSKYNEKAALPSQSFELRASLGTYIQGIPTPVGNFSSQCGADVDDSGKKWSVKRSSNAAQGLEPVRPDEEPLQLKQNSGHEKPRQLKHNSSHEEVFQMKCNSGHERPLQLKHNSGHKELLQPKKNSGHENGQQSTQLVNGAPQAGGPLVSLCKEDERTKFRHGCLDNEFKQMASKGYLTVENCHGPSHGTHGDSTLPVDLVADGEENTITNNEKFLYMPACGDSGKIMEAKEQKNASLPSEEARHGLCVPLENLKNKARNPDRRNRGITESIKKSRSYSSKDVNVGVRRLRRNTRKNVPTDAEVGSGNGAENRLLPSAEPIVSPPARKDNPKPLIQEGVLDEQKHSNLHGGCSSGGIRRLDCSSMVPRQSNTSTMNHCGDVVGVRRSVRINGKHVPTDDEPHVEIWAYDDNLDLVEFRADMTGKKDKEKITTTSVGVESVEGRSHASDKVQLEQSDRQTYDSQKVNRKRRPETRNFKKNGEVKKSISDKHPSPKEDMSVETLVSEKSMLSSAANKTLTGSRNSDAKKKRIRNGGCGLSVRLGRKNDHYEEILAQSNVSILSWLIDSDTLAEKEKVVCITNNETSKVSDGLVTRGGILCECCKEVLPLVKFVAHAGSNIYRPWDNIFLLSGKTLIQCLREAWEKEKEQKKIGFRTVGTDGPDPSDDTCGICADGGHLICCDNCPATFHQDCLLLKVLPEDRWCCPYCRCSFCTAAGSGSYKELDTSTLLTCKQCGCKYHLGCASGRGMHDMDYMSYIFCGGNCKKISDQLMALLGTSNPIEGGFSWTLLKHLGEDEGVSPNEKLSLIMECNVKLSMALSVLNECFLPLIDHRTGVDMICQAVYNCGSNFNRLNYEGFYTLILEKDEEIISAASLRFHGTKLAEMPFIGTRPVFRRQGMCRRLIMAIEDMLSLLYVEKLIIPAIPDLLETWMTSFSFKPLGLPLKDEIRNLSMVVFPETTLLQKSLCNRRAMSLEGNATSKSVSGIHFRRDGPQNNSIVNVDKQREKSHGLPNTYAEHINNSAYVVGQERYNHWYNIEGQTSNTDPGSLTCAYSLKGQQDANVDPRRTIQVPNHQNDTSLEPRRTIQVSNRAPDQLSLSPLNTSNYSLSGTSNSYTSMPSQNMVPLSYSSPPFSLPSVNAATGHDPERSVVNPSNSYTNEWFWGTDQVRDVLDDSIRSSIAFDSLLRIKS